MTSGPGITSGWLTCPCQLGRAVGFQVDSCYLLTGQTKQPIALLKLCLLPDNFSYFYPDKDDTTATSKHSNGTNEWITSGRGVECQSVRTQHKREQRPRWQLFTCKLLWKLNAFILHCRINIPIRWNHNAVIVPSKLIFDNNRPTNYPFITRLKKGYKAWRRQQPRSHYSRLATTGDTQ